LALQALSPATAQTVATIEQIQSDLTRAQERLSKRKELRRLERKDQYVVGEIRRLLDEQDRLQLSVQALELQLRQAGMDNDDIALILALAS
jgi:3-oxoacyl-[acyl-carrier-protein] synthase III